jgi:hypothetical protein
MGKSTYSSGFSHEGRDVKFQLGIYLFMEDGAWIAYCPALDLSACGVDDGFLHEEVG